MQRLCGRPGCSDAASVVYGMRAEDLVFWIDVLPDPLEDGAGVLCLRHADSMVVPRGWTLDDLRDPDLHLFRPPLPAPTLRTRSPRSSRGHAISEQLRFGEDTDPTADPNRAADPDPAPERLTLTLTLTATAVLVPTVVRGRRRSTRPTTSMGS